mmetsp:Transcript_2014/g.5355  ORF Transcript_2014/g.5355 Transcript_2014/m.5355 type:complete len:409 (-) Transcript_2014:1397-2623(-)
MSDKGGCTICRLISTLLTLALIAGGGYAAWFFLGQPTADEAVEDLGEFGKDFVDLIKEIDFGDFTDVLNNFTGFTSDLFDEDPFVGDNTTNVWRGHTKGTGGLTLELWNALDETWQTEYAESVNDWNTLCNPKVLVLTNKDVELDRECIQTDGIMKVCNGNYGETGWLGINEVLKTVPAGIIQSSVAKMNEHYLRNADYDERLYTMCHEIGHGFGLPHTDENFGNSDLGNCLDYTNTPSNNLRPGDANCNRLLGMYGSVDGGRRKISQTWVRRALRYRSDAELYEDGEDESYTDEEESYTDDAQYYYESAREEYPNLSAEYETAMEEFYYELEQGSLGRSSHANANDDEDDDDDYDDDDDDDDASINVREERDRGRWRRLREHSGGGDFVRRLNDGFELEVHLLYARE